MRAGKPIPFPTPSGNTVPQTPTAAGLVSGAAGTRAGASTHDSAPQDSYERHAGGAFAAFVVAHQGFGPPKSFGRLPEVAPQDPASWRRYHQALAERVVGNRASLFDLRTGNPWAMRDEAFAERIAVGWAMQQNPHVRYDADRRTFVVEDGAGNRRDVASLRDAMGTIQARGGLHQANGAAMVAVGMDLAARVAGASRGGGGAAVVVAEATEATGASPAGTRSDAPSDGGLERLLTRFASLLRSLFGGEEPPPPRS